MDKKHKKEKITMKSVANESILMFFNDYLYRNNILSDEEKEKMAVSIATMSNLQTDQHKENAN